MLRFITILGIAFREKNATSIILVYESRFELRTSEECKKLTKPFDVMTSLVYYENLGVCGGSSDKGLLLAREVEASRFTRT